LLDSNGFFFTSIPSFEKKENFCIQIEKNTNKFWIFPKDSLENQRFLAIFAEILEKKADKKPFSSQNLAFLKNSMKNSGKNGLKNSFKNSLKNPKKLKKALTDSFLNENYDIPSNNIDLSFSSKKAFFLHEKTEGFCEENAESLEEEIKQIYEEVLCEGRFPDEIKDFSLSKHHETLFKEAFSGEKPKEKPILLINPEEFTEKNHQIFLQNNLFFFQQYQCEKSPFYQHFLFPKTEDFLDENSLKNIEKNEDFALNLAQQFLWEFQLENADKIYNIHKEKREFAQGFYEISLMKILVSGKKSLIFSLIDQITDIKPSHFPPNTAENLLLLSELFLIKGLLYMLLQSKFQAFLSVKESYSLLKKAGISNKTFFSLSASSLSRFLLISGAFQLGLSLLPLQYRRILELLGLSLDKQKGLENLKKCIGDNKSRSNYARLLLGLYYIEGDASSFDEAFSLIKSSLSLLNKSPLINWLASLFSWRFLQGSEALKLIMRSLANIGGKLINEAYYLKFELAWFEMSKCQWVNALGLFEELAIMSRSLINRAKCLEIGILEEYPKNLSAKISGNLTAKSSSANLTRKKGIILPHRNALAMIISICYINLKEEDLSEIWLYMVQYIEKKFAGDSYRTTLDEDIAKISQKYLKRSKKFFLKYEILYFLKEISKLKDSNLLQMKEGILAFFEENYEISLYNHKEILAFYQKNPIFLSPFLVEYASGLFLLIIILCVLRNLKELLLLGEKLKDIQDLLPKDHEYLLHHGFYWVGRCYLLEETPNKEEKALEFFKLSRKYQECEFSMKSRNSKSIIEVKKLILSKK